MQMSVYRCCSIRERVLPQNDFRGMTYQKVLCHRVSVREGFPSNSLKFLRNIATCVRTVDQFIFFRVLLLEFVKQTKKQL